MESIKQKISSFFSIASAKPMAVKASVAAMLMAAGVAQHSERPPEPLGAVGNLVEDITKIRPESDEAAEKTLLDMHLRQDPELMAYYNNFVAEVKEDCKGGVIENCSQEQQDKALLLYKAYNPSRAFEAWGMVRQTRLLASTFVDDDFIAARANWPEMNSAMRMQVIKRLGGLHDKAYKADGFKTYPARLEAADIDSTTKATYAWYGNKKRPYAVVQFNSEFLQYASFNEVVGTLFHELQHHTQLMLVHNLRRGGNYAALNNINGDVHVFKYSLDELKLPWRICKDARMEKDCLFTEAYFSKPTERDAERFKNNALWVGRTEEQRALAYQLARYSGQERVMEVAEEYLRTLDGEKKRTDNSLWVKLQRTDTVDKNVVFMAESKAPLARDSRTTQKNTYFKSWASLTF